MKPVNFDLANATLLGGDPKRFGTYVRDLKIYRGDVNGIPGIVSRWKPTVRERICLLFGGSVWMHFLSTANTHPPVAVTASHDYLSIEEEGEENS